MSKNAVCVEHLISGEKYLLDIDNCFLQKIKKEDDFKVQGQFCKFDEKNDLFLYCKNGILFFQWNKNNWNIEDLSHKFDYRHDFNKKTTLFSVDNIILEYDAWWKDDPFYNKFAPELDEREDYFAYIMQVRKNSKLRNNLLNAYMN